MSVCVICGAAMARSWQGGGNPRQVCSDKCHAVRRRRQAGQPDESVYRTDAWRQAISEGRRKAWAEAPHRIGLAEMRAASEAGECPFCGDPVGMGATKPLQSCGEPECETAYFRYYQRDRRAKQRAERSAA